VTVSQEELQRIRADAEVAVLATLKGCLDDAGAICDHIATNNVDMDLVARALKTTDEASSALRCLRDEFEMSIRADAYESLAKLP
jgi:hypothetical protein